MYYISIWYIIAPLSSFIALKGTKRIITMKAIGSISHGIGFKDRQGVSGRCAALGHINSQLWQL